MSDYDFDLFVVGAGSGGVRAAIAEGLTVIMDRCPKIEYARLSGEIGWNGVNSRVLSSKKPAMGKGFQSYGLNRAK